MSQKPTLIHHSRQIFKYICSFILIGDKDLAKSPSLFYFSSKTLANHEYSMSSSKVDILKRSLVENLDWNEISFDLFNDCVQKTLVKMIQTHQLSEMPSLLDKTQKYAVKSRNIKLLI